MWRERGQDSKDNGVERPVKERGGDVYSLPPTCYPLAVIHLNNTNPTADFSQRAIDPHNPTHVHPLTQGDTSGEVDKVEQIEHNHHLPGHIVVCALKIDSRSAQWRGGLGAVVGGRDASVGAVVMLITFDTL
jgi:hypothetical protein